MNFKVYILFVATALIVYGCPGSMNQKEIKKLQENKNNLPDLVKQTYSGISFKLSSLFERDYNSSYTVKNNPFSRSIYNLGLYFSLEYFDLREVETIKFAFENDISGIEAVHEYYIDKRINSVFSPFLSIRKELPKKNSPQGYIQVVEGPTYEFGESITYFTATFKVEEKIYVMQMIGKTGNMDYIYDDFLAIINSVN